MLKQLGYASLDELTNAAVPDNIKLNRDLLLGKINKIKTKKIILSYKISQNL